MPLFGSIDNAANSAGALAVGLVNQGNSTTNKNNLYGNTTANVIVQRQTVGVFAVDAAEMRAARANNASRPAHAGWVLRREGQGGRAGRVTYEVLVAGGSISGDGAEGLTVLPNVAINLVTSPQSNSQAINNPVTLTINAGIVPPGSANLRILWQVDGGPGVRTWANVANTGVYASANGNTTAVLTISNNATLSGNVYSALLSADVAIAPRRTANATVTVV